jgi:hypothetical protein
MGKAEFLKQQAAKCRRFAAGADERTALALTTMVEEYEAEAAETIAQLPNEMPRAT